MFSFGSSQGIENGTTSLILQDPLPGKLTALNFSQNLPHSFPRFFRNNAGELKKIFDLQNDIIDSKNMIISKLQQIKQVTGTFLKTEDGFKVTNAEGFVAVDRLKGNAVKLVDRLEFSHANFTAQKNWSN